MKKVSDLRQVFRTINEGLQSLSSMDVNEKNKTIQALVVINEALGDETESLLINYLTLKHETRRELRNASASSEN